jgi:citronellyl-CoA dehydrogenase
MERLSGTLCFLLTLQRLITDTAAYARSRVVFGRPLLANQVVHFRLAELMTEVEALRALIYRAGGEMMQYGALMYRAAVRGCRDDVGWCARVQGGH